MQPKRYVFGDLPWTALFTDSNTDHGAIGAFPAGGSGVARQSSAISHGPSSPRDVLPTPKTPTGRFRRPPSRGGEGGTLTMLRSRLDEGVSDD